MKTETAIKTGISGLGVVLSFYMNNISPLLWLLVLFEAGDYITGIIAACRRKGLSSREAFWGFIKKLCYFILVGVAFGVDYFIGEAINTVGLDVNYPAVFGVLAICYLLSTEAISILENLGAQGIEVPFLSRFIEKLRDKIAAKGGEERKGE